MTEQPLSDTEPEVYEEPGLDPVAVLLLIAIVLLMGIIFTACLFVFSSPGGQAH